LVEITFCLSLTPSYIRFVPNLLSSIKESLKSFKINLLIVQPSAIESSQIKSLIKLLSIDDITTLLVDNYEAKSYVDLRGYIENQRVFVLSNKKIFRM